MAVEVRIPKEITEYQEKILFGLSIRQLICTILAISISIPSYIFLLPIFGVDMTGYIVILEIVPFVAFGFLKPKGLKFEKVLVLFLKHQLGEARRIYCSIVQLDLLEGEKNDIQKKSNKKLFRKNIKKEREFKGFEPSKKARERKYKEIKKQIKMAKRTFRRGKKGR